MRWSIPCGRVLGIRIRVHLSFLLLLLWVAWLGWQVGGGVASLWALLLVNLLFGCVVLHELGHSVMAIRFGVHVESITLLPIGGVASMRSIPERPIREFLISVAGPMVNVVIACVLLLVRGGLPSYSALPPLPTNLGELVDMLLVTNIILVVFNLIPAFPMDGGRILRSLLALKLSYARATNVAVGFGQVFAVAFIAVGIFGNPFLAVIGVFVYLGAKSEQQRIRTRSMLRNVLAEDVMVTAFATLRPDDTLQRCLEHVYHQNQEDFPVVADGKLVGLLPRKQWLAVLHRDGIGARVGDIMKHRFISVYPESDLAHIYQDLLSTDQGVFPVVQGQRVLGLLTTEDIGRYVMIEGLRRDVTNTGVGGGEGKSGPRGLTVDLG